MATKKTIDGHYILYPMGGCWEYYEIVGEQVVSQTAESNMGTHMAARDRWSWLGDIDHEATGRLDDEDMSERVLVACGYGADALIDVSLIDVS